MIWYNEHKTQYQSRSKGLKLLNTTESFPLKCSRTRSSFVKSELTKTTVLSAAFFTKSVSSGVKSPEAVVASKSFLEALAVGPFDSGGVCSMGPCFAMIYNWYALGSTD